MLGFITKNRFFDPSQTLPQAGIAQGSTVADFGCGNGHFPVAAAKIVGNSGQVYAIDIVSEALEATMSAAKHEGLKNIYTIRHNLEQPGLAVTENSCDAVILSGILHTAKEHKNILREAYRVLKTGGKIIVIEWKKNLLPFGPDMKHRISEDDANQLLTQNSFRFQAQLPSDNFHYALVYVK